MRLVAVIGLICVLNTGIYSQDYYVNTYSSNSDSLSNFKQIRIIRVNLQMADVAEEIILADSGTIENKKPFEVFSHGSIFLIAFWTNGQMAKNSGFGSGHSDLKYSIVNANDKDMQVIYSRDLPDANISLLDQIPGEQGFRLKIVNDSNDSTILQPGIYDLNEDNSFDFKSRVQLNEIPGGIGNLDGFALLRKIWRSEEYHLYHSFHRSQYWLVKLNDKDNLVVDSLQLRQSGGQATIYAYHPGRDKFYCFHLNYEMHGQYTNKFRQDYYIDPEVLIYDPVSLRLLERNPVADYPDGEYPGRENGLADVVGDYIVYYFFQDDWMGKYAPAMLFIFDTRTNEASWLRVGWR